MSRLTNDIDAINQAVSQNVVSLVASVLSLVGILIAMFVLNRLAGAGGRAGRADHVLVHAVRRALHAQGFPRPAEGTGRDQRRDGGSRSADSAWSRPFGAARAPIERFRASNQKVYKAGVYANTYALDAHAADECAGQLLRHRAGRAWAAIWPCRAWSPSA